MLAIQAMESVSLPLTGYHKGMSMYEKTLTPPLFIVIISPLSLPNKEQSTIPFAKSCFKLAIFTTLTPVFVYPVFVPLMVFIYIHKEAELLDSDA